MVEIKIMNKQAKLLMIQGTGSNVGKSVLVAGLCRYFVQQGLKVAPFKAQNMALNSFITPEGHEMGRAQAVQAEACKITPHVDMNPVLIKPNTDVGAQVIIHGVPVGNMSAMDYHQYKEKAWPAVLTSFKRLAATYDLIVIEGAGSPAEVNLREHDIVNMGLALAVQAPVLLVGDIDKGGVFAAFVGTIALLAPEERQLVKGLIINKFRGDIGLLEPGLAPIAARCKVPFVGVVPYFRGFYVPEEDGVAVENYGRGKIVREEADHVLAIAVIKLPHIANFTDFDPLLHEMDVRLDYLLPEDELVGYDLVILPGSKNTIDDLRTLCRVGFPQRLHDFVKAGGAVVGICGGYQMLGQKISDPHQVETTSGSVSGFGLLPVITELAREKITVQSQGRLLFPFGAGEANLQVAGYEIHMGRTSLLSGAKPLLQLAPVADSDHDAGHPDGAVNAEGLCWGTYLHGIFDQDIFRRAWLDFLKKRRYGFVEQTGSRTSFAKLKEQGLNQLAALLSANLKMSDITKIIGL